MESDSIYSTLYKVWGIVTVRNKELIAEEQFRRIKEELKQELEGTVGKKNWREFQQFAFKDNLIQMAIAFMLGAAFKKVVSGIADFLIMPLVNYAIGHTGEEWREITWTPIEGLAFEIGKCASVFIDFFLMAIILFVMWKKLIAPIFAEENEDKPKVKCIDTVECPECFGEIDYRSKRCPNCTSWIYKEEAKS